MSTWKGKDDCTDTILDLIAEHESAGNYNAVIGHVHATDDLGQYSIRQIYGKMDRLLYQEHMPSTAVGRYQIIRKTLKSLVAQLQLPETTLFTQELQDKLAVQLLKVRGYQKWWLGKLSNVDFAHQLSCEWASLPDPYNGGRSHYDGIAGNHAGMTLKHLYDGLDRAKTLKPHGS